MKDNKKYMVRIDCFIEESEIFGEVDVEANCKEHAGIKACAEFINGYPGSYGLRVTSVKELKTGA